MKYPIDDGIRMPLSADEFSLGLNLCPDRITDFFQRNGIRLPGTSKEQCIAYQVLCTLVDVDVQLVVDATVNGNYVPRALVFTRNGRDVDYEVF